MESRERAILTIIKVQAGEELDNPFKVAAALVMLIITEVYEDLRHKPFFPFDPGNTFLLKL